MINKRFNKQNDAFNYTKHNDYNILVIDVKYFDNKTNTYEHCYNYLCLSNNDYYNFIKNENDKKNKKTIQVYNENIKKTEKIETDYKFELLTKNKRKLYFDIDKTPKKDIKKAIDLLKNQVKQHLNIVDEPLIFIRENYFTTENEDELCSFHIIYNKISMDYLQQNHLIKFIQLEFLHNKLNIDTAIYTKNRVFNLPYNTKEKYKNNYFIPLNDYTKKLYDDDIKNCLINNTDNTNIIEYEKKFIQETNKDNINYDKIKSDNETLIDDLIQRLPNEFYKNNKIWKILIHYIYNNGYDYVKFMKHSAKIINIDSNDTSINDYINNYIKVLYINSNHIFNVIANVYKLYFDFNKNYSLDYVKWISDIVELDQKTIIQKLDNYYENYSKTKKKSTKKLIINGFTILLSSQVILTKKTFYYYPLSKIEKISNYKKQSQVMDIKKLQEHLSYMWNKQNDKSKKKLYRLCGINAKWGSGKSFFIVMQILELSQETNCKVLLITDNNSLNSENVIKYQKYGAINHQQVRDGEKTLEEFNDARVAICSPESICKLKNNYDIVILDEYETLTNHYSSETMNKEKSSDYDKFKNIKNKLLNSKSIFCLDADLSLERMSIIEKMINVNAKLFYCENNNFNNTDHNIYYNKTEFIAKINDDLNNNKRVSICSNGKKELICYKEMINEKFITKRTMIITSDLYVKFTNCNIEELKKTDVLKNLQQTIIDYDIEVFLYSSSIKTGISINKALFHKLYAIGYNLNVCNAREFIQMLYRNRILIDDTINIHFNSFYNKYSNGINKKLLEFNLTSLLKQKYKNDYENDKTDNDYFNLRLTNNIENEYSKNCFNQDTITRLKQHDLKVNLIYTDFSSKKINKLYMETKALLKEETLNKLSNLDLITHDEYETIHRQEIKTEDDCLKIDKFFLFKNSGLEQYNEIFLNEKRDTNDNILINNTEYIKTLIENKDTIDNFKVYEKKQLYNEMQFIDNKDKQVIQFNKLNELLIFFNCDNYYNEISNDKINKLILNNKSYIQKNFNFFQSILLETKDINYEIETKDELLIKNVISLLKKLGKYGIHCAYLNSGNIYYDGNNYKYNIKDNARASNKNSILYIVNNIKHLFNFNNFYFNYKYNNIKKVYIDDKIFIENGEKSNIEKKIIKTNTNKSVTENGKKVKPKILIDTEEQLYYNKINVYNNVNTKKDILNYLDSIKPIIKVVNGKKYDNFADLINKKVRAYNHNKDIYNREHELKKLKEFYTNKKLPIINKYNYQAFNTDDKDNKIITFSLEKEIQYAIHIRPFIKYKKIYRHFYKDYYVLQTDYIDYINIGLYLNNIGINFDYDREYITENNLNDNIIENYEPNNNFTSNFIPIKIYRYKENNSLILYKNAITNEKIPSYDVLKDLQQLKIEQIKIINITNDKNNDKNNENTNDNNIDNDNDYNSDDNSNEKYENKVDKKIDNSFNYNLNNIIKIVDLLIDYKTNKDFHIIIEIKNIIEDKTDFIDYNNYYESFIISKRDLFFEFSKKDIKLWGKLVYKLYV